MDTPLNVGFIGLGAMGFPMAVNLITKLAKGSKLYIFDVSKDAMARFAQLHPESSEICDSPKSVAEKAVCLAKSSLIKLLSDDSLTCHNVNRQLSSPWSQKAPTSAQSTSTNPTDS